MRQFFTVDDSSSAARPCDPDDLRNDQVYVCEILQGGLDVPVDEDGAECGESEAVRSVSSDLYCPVACCRSPDRKLPPQSPIEALRGKALKNKEGLRIGDTVSLNGIEVTL